MLRRFDHRWALLHLLPAVLLTVGMSALASVVTPDLLGAGILLLMLAVVSLGEVRLMLGNGTTTLLRSTLKTACTYAAALMLALVMMSTIDIAGYDRAASLSAMMSAGLLIGVVQMRMWRLDAYWVAASVVGWLLGAILFRMTAGALPDLQLGGIQPFSIIRSAGHNELIWSCLGLGAYGLVTAPFVSMSVRYEQ